MSDNFTIIEALLQVGRHWRTINRDHPTPINASETGGETVPKFEDRTKLTLEEARKRIETLSESTSGNCHIVVNEDASYSVFSHSELTNCDYCAEELLGRTVHAAKEEVFITGKSFSKTDLV